MSATLPLWQPSTRQRIREAWASRYLLPGLARTAIPTHSGQLLGRSWIVLRPFMQVFGFAVIFGGVFRVRTPNGVPYIVFMLLGIQGFRVFETTMIYSTLSSKLLKTVVRPLRVPLLLYPFAGSAYALLQLAIYWVFTVSVLVYYVIRDHHLYLKIRPELLVGLAGTSLCIAYGLAIGLTTAVLYPRARDMRYFIRYGSQLLLLFTPVLYPLSALSPGYRKLAEVNPLTGVMGMVQWGYLGAPRPTLWSLCWSLGGLVVATTFGLWMFNRYATRFLGVGIEQRRGVDDDPDDDADIGF